MKKIISVSSAVAKTAEKVTSCRAAKAVWAANTALPYSLPAPILAVIAVIAAIAAIMEGASNGLLPEAWTFAVKVFAAGGNAIIALLVVAAVVAAFETIFVMVKKTVATVIAVAEASKASRNQHPTKQPATKQPVSTATATSTLAYFRSEVGKRDAARAMALYKELYFASSASVTAEDTAAYCLMRRSCDAAQAVRLTLAKAAPAAAEEMLHTVQRFETVQKAPETAE